MGQDDLHAVRSEHVFRESRLTGRHCNTCRKTGANLRGAGMRSDDTARRVTLPWLLTGGMLMMNKASWYQIRRAEKQKK